MEDRVISNLFKLQQGRFLLSNSKISATLEYQVFKNKPEICQNTTDPGLGYQDSLGDL